MEGGHSVKVKARVRPLFHWHVNSFHNKQIIRTLTVCLRISWISKINNKVNISWYLAMTCNKDSTMTYTKGLSDYVWFNVCIGNNSRKIYKKKNRFEGSRVHRPVGPETKTESHACTSDRSVVKWLSIFLFKRAGEFPYLSLSFSLQLEFRPTMKFRIVLYCVVTTFNLVTLHRL